MRESTILEFTPETRPHWVWSPEAIRHVGHLVVKLIVQLLSADVPHTGQTFLTSTTLDSTFARRACIINPRTTAEGLAYQVTLVRDLGRQLAGGGA